MLCARMRSASSAKAIKRSSCNGLDWSMAADKGTRAPDAVADRIHGREVQGVRWKCARAPWTPPDETGFRQNLTAARVFRSMRRVLNGLECPPGSCERQRVECTTELSPLAGRSQPPKRWHRSPAHVGIPYELAAENTHGYRSTVTLKPRQRGGCSAGFPRHLPWPPARSRQDIARV